jgi:GntR family transcriptional regulator/MocR family aminotransferase
MIDLPAHIDAAADTPLHRQVYDAVRSAILTGRLRPGERLPATRTLADDLGLSRMTVAQAYDQLRSEGYIEGRHGSGTYVAPGLPDAALHAGVGGDSSAVGGQVSVRLSSWGRQVMGDTYRRQLREEGSRTYRWDFRPHRIASDLFPWDAWRASVDRALAEDREHLLPYPPTAGHPALREAIAAHIARFRGVVCTPDQVVVVNGTQQGLNLLTQLLLDGGDAVAVEDPGYPTARRVFESRGLRIIRVPVDADGMEVAELEDRGSPQLVHVTPSHQDPTGATLSLARRAALLEYAERTGCLIFEDDYDSEFRYEGRPVESLQGLDRHGLVVYAGSFSKSLLSGLRIGFLVLPSALVEAVVAAKAIWDGGTPMLEQAALARFLQSGDFERHIRRMRRLYRRRRDALVEALSEEFGPRASVGERHGGLNVLVGLDMDISAIELSRRAASAGIGVRAASSYYAQPPTAPTFLLGFGAIPDEEIRAGIGAFASIARALTAST